MSRKRRSAKAQVRELPSPAWTWWLLMGEAPGCRVHGWPAQAQAGGCGQPTAAEIWQLHAAALVAEARAHDFEPAWLTARRPHGPQVDAWTQSFLAEHGY